MKNKKTKTDKEDMQKKIVQFQILESNLKMLQERAMLVSQTLDEYQKTREALLNLETTKPEKALIPIGSGNFVEGKIDNTEDVIVDVGNSIVLKKKRKDALKILDEKITEMQNSLNDITKKSQMLIKGLEDIQCEIENMQSD